jgi:hypothetical protein
LSITGGITLLGGLFILSIAGGITLFGGLFILSIAGGITMLGGLFILSITGGSLSKNVQLGKVLLESLFLFSLNKQAKFLIVCFSVSVNKLKLDEFINV